MTRRGPRIVAALLVIGAAAHGRSVSAAPHGRPEAPEFSLGDLEGRPLTLTGFRGNVVLLNFWATWCAPCRAEIPRLIALQRTYASRGLRIVGISLDDDPAPVRRSSEELGIDYPVAIGDARLAQRYGGILGLPVTFVIDCEGRIVSKHEGEIDAARVERRIRPLLREAGCRNPAREQPKPSR